MLVLASLFRKTYYYLEKNNNINYKRAKKTRIAKNQLTLAMAPLHACQQLGSGRVVVAVVGGVCQETQQAARHRRRGMGINWGQKIYWMLITEKTEYYEILLRDKIVEKNTIN